MICSKLVFLLTVALCTQLSCGIRDSTPPAMLIEGYPAFTSPQNLGADKWLIISMPGSSKISYTHVMNMESDDTLSALIDSGLDTPKGLAFDKNLGFLYVADSGAEKIFRYTIIVDQTGDTAALTTTDARLTIVQDCGPVEWVTVDAAGNLFYSAPLTNNINKISADVMKQVATGEIHAGELTIIRSKTLQESQANATDAAADIELNSDGEVLPTDAPPVAAEILSIYEAELNPNVAHPACIWANGPDLYWTNQADGTTAGTVVKGMVDPVLPSNATDTTPYPATALTTVSDAGYGFAMTDDFGFFVRSSDIPNTTVISVLKFDTDILVDIETNMLSPRAIVYDGDQTMYVADELDNVVQSFPAGRMMENAPLTPTVSVAGPFGLVLLTSDDPCFERNTVGSDGTISSMPLDDLTLPTDAPTANSTNLTSASNATVLGQVTLLQSKSRTGRWMLL